MKSKRSTGLDEPGLDSSAELGLDSLDDDDIIDLEDIVEMPERSFDDDETDHSGAGIFDTQGDPDLDLHRKAPPILEEEDDEETSNSLIHELSSFHDERADAAPAMFEPPVEKPAPKIEPPVEEPLQAEDDPLEALIEAERQKVGIGADAAPPEPPDTLPPLAEDADEESAREFARMLAEAEQLSDDPEEPTILEDAAPAEEPTILEDAALPELEEPELPPLEPHVEDIPDPGTDVEISAGLDAHIDQVIDGIEARLVDAVRAIVDERLPDIVREVIREEMEKIKAGK
jgi:hypothetical protein